MVKLLDVPAFSALAGDWLRKHRHGVDTSEAHDDLRQLLVEVRDQSLRDAAKLVRGLHGAQGLIFQEAAADCIEKLAAKSCALSERRRP